MIDKLNTIRAQLESLGYKREASIECLFIDDQFAECWQRKSGNNIILVYNRDNSKIQIFEEK